MKVCQHSWHLVLTIPQTEDFEERREDHRKAVQHFLYNLTALADERNEKKIDEDALDGLSFEEIDEKYEEGCGELLLQ